MEVGTIDSFLNYYDRIKARTKRLLTYIPEDKMEWTFREGKFTIGDIIRHLANLERFMFAENVQGNPSSYTDCGIEYARGKEEIIAYYDAMYEESRAIFAGLSPEDLQSKCLTPGGASITVWKWLRAMVEHEVHHRGQLYIYLSILEVKTPPMFGLTSEEVAERSKGK